jgi:16S rRNA (adenine(1408)-N(1))-methyltransferase
VTIARVVGKGRIEAMTAEAFTAACKDWSRTFVDVGTGDGRYARAIASERPDWLVIGIDALAEPMEETARKAKRDNLLFVRASIESVPSELHGIADVVTVMLPWGVLLEGIVLARDDVLRGLAALCGPAARVEVTLNGEIWHDSTPLRFVDLPVPTPEYVADVVAPAFARAGIDVGAARWLDASEAKNIPSTWARKLGHRRAHPKFLRFERIATESG